VIYQQGAKVFSKEDTNVCFYKSDQWKYEEEWRCVRSFGGSESRVAGIDPQSAKQMFHSRRISLLMDEGYVDEQHYFLNHLSRILIFAERHEL
jgi:hypothetical protein